MRKTTLVGTMILASLLSGFSEVAGQNVLNLSVEQTDVVITGSKRPSFSISSVASGDINGDGISDIIIASPLRKHIAVVFGKPELPSSIQLFGTSQPDLIITYPIGTTDVSPRIHVADINGDGIGDLLVPGHGEFDMFWGRRDWPSHIDMELASPSVRIGTDRKADTGATSISSVTTGDVNGDGIEDVIFSHQFFSKHPQRKDWSVVPTRVGWMFYGKKSWPSLVTLNDQNADSVIWAEQPKPFLGDHIRQLTVTDLNGDGFGDILVSTWGPKQGITTPPKDGPWARAWIIQGADQLPKSIGLGKVHKDKTDAKTLLLTHRNGELQIGGGLAVGNFTGAKFKDLVLTVFSVGNDAARRRICLIPGNLQFFSSKEFNLHKGCINIVGDESLENVYPPATRPPLVGDFNGDKRDDLFLLAGPPSFNIYGLLGRTSYSATVNLDRESDIRIDTPIGQFMKGGFGISMAVGDINGDGYQDLLIVDAFGGNDLKDQIGPGKVHVILGRDLKSVGALQ